jgi:hypothetical protein
MNCDVIEAIVASLGALVMSLNDLCYYGSTVVSLKCFWLHWGDHVIMGGVNRCNINGKNWGKCVQVLLRVLVIWLISLVSCLLFLCKVL